MNQLDLDRVRELFSLFSDLEDESLERWNGLWASAAASLARRLRTDAVPSEHMEALCTAAAGIAYSDYLAVQSAVSVGGEVRVGDITLRETSASADGGAAELREHFLASVAYLLETACPALIAVPGGDAS